MSPRSWRGPLIFLGIAFSVLGAWGRDFPEPIFVLDPLLCVRGEGFSFLSSGYGEVSHNNHIFLGTGDDTFDLNALGAYTLFSLGEHFGLNVYYGTFLYVGPLKEGDTPATIAPWWMNAVQFEYGLIAAFNLSGFHFLLEYSRASQHPIRGQFSEVTTDAIKVGVVTPVLRHHSLSSIYWIRTGSVDLFDFWKSTVPKPSALWVVSPACYSELGLFQGLSLFLDISLDAYFLRKGGMDADIWLESGLLLGTLPARLQLFLEYYHSGNTEEKAGVESPADLLGLGFRLSVNTRTL